MPTPNKIQLVIFDWAGTTIDFGCLAPSGAFVAAFAQRGVQVSIAEARGPMGLHKKDHIREMLRIPEIAGRWQSANSSAWTEADVQALYEIVTPMQVDAARKYSELIPEVLPCIAELRKRGIKIAASTGYFHEAAQIVAEAGAKQGYIPDANICADDVSAGRPAPWMIYRLMEQLNVYPPEAVVKVGDTVVDIQDGRNAGCWSFGVVNSSNEMGLSRTEFEALNDGERDQRRNAIAKKYLMAGAHNILDSLEQLPFYIEQTNAAMRTLS